MILGRDHIEASVDAWEKGQRSPSFNDAAEAAGEAPKRVSMAAANDTAPGILGYNR